MHTKNTITLDMLPVGASGYVLNVNIGGAMGRRLMDIGLARGTHVTCLRKAPSGDPAAYLIHGAVVAVRSCDAREVVLSRL